jgi:bifunctional UDP-N-acetylglucosamine pyrophosphorylase/glucosamine-1-phosphate N-acetyltransferase
MVITELAVFEIARRGDTRVTLLELAPDVTLFPDTMLQGECVIGAGVRLGPNTHLVDSVVESGAVVEHSVGRACRVGERAVIGPYSVLEAGSVVPADARPGPFYTASF